MLPAQWRRQDARTQRATGDTNASQRGGGGIAERFKQFDRNGDGKLTPAEFPRAEMFKQMDKNVDGVVTSEEARAFLGGRRQQGTNGN
jgi:Ca2+-binding EF-hand superfamily protein